MPKVGYFKQFYNRRIKLDDSISFIAFTKIWIYINIRNVITNILGIVDYRQITTAWINFEML